MAISMKDLKKRVKTVTVEFQGDTAEVTYRVNVITPQFQDQITEMKTNRAAVVAMVREAVEDWDVVESEDGPRISPEAEMVKELPLDFLNAVMNAIFDDMRAPEEEKKA